MSEVVVPINQRQGAALVQLQHTLALAQRELDAYVRALLYGADISQTPRTLVLTDAGLVVTLDDPPS